MKKWMVIMLVIKRQSKQQSFFFSNMHAKFLSINLLINACKFFFLITKDLLDLLGKALCKNDFLTCMDNITWGKYLHAPTLGYISWARIVYGS